MERFRAAASHHVLVETRRKRWILVLCRWDNQSNFGGRELNHLAVMIHLFLLPGGNLGRKKRREATWSNLLVTWLSE